MITKKLVKYRGRGGVVQNLRIVVTKYSVPFGIRSFRSLSKQAKKEWMYKHRNTGNFNWEEEEEM